uniref:Uncharacterized protein n=1 Tax=Arundo donax TaxID=35708 RepID=A0A0A9FF26_ARUDO
MVFDGYRGDFWELIGRICIIESPDTCYIYYFLSTPILSTSFLHFC